MINSNIQLLFLILVLTQALHSFEEYLGQLWIKLPPAAFLCSLVSDDLKLGFLTINIGLFIFGIWAWALPIRKNHAFAIYIIWFWIAIELINGVGHPLWSLINGKYMPGTLTAAFLLPMAIVLAKRQLNIGSDSKL